MTFSRCTRLAPEVGVVAAVAVMVAVPVSIAAKGVNRRRKWRWRGWRRIWARREIGVK